MLLLFMLSSSSSSSSSEDFNKSFLLAFADVDATAECLDNRSKICTRSIVIA
jgi:hypothetical protein